MNEDWLAGAPVPVELPDARRATGASVEARHRRREEIELAYARRAVTYLLLDISGSMIADDKLASVTRGAVAFAKDAFAQGYRVGVITFSTHAALVCDATEALAELEEKLGRLRADGTTNMAAALALAGETLGGSGKRVVVLATDGMADSTTDALAAADRLKAAGVRIMTIGTPDSDREFLASIASDAGLSEVAANQDIGRRLASAARLLELPPSGGG